MLKFNRNAINNEIAYIDCINISSQKPIDYPIEYYYDAKLYKKYLYLDFNEYRSEGTRAKVDIQKFTTIVVEQPLVFIEANYAELLQNEKLNLIFKFKKMKEKCTKLQFFLEDLFLFGLLAKILMPDFKFMKEFLDLSEGNLDQIQEDQQKLTEIGWKCLKKNLKQNNEISKEFFSTLLNRVFVNNYTTGDKANFETISGFAIYPKSSKLNHSCNPNCFCFSEGSLMKTRTLRDIKADEEVTHSYIADQYYLPRRLRQYLLLQNFNFLCNCQKCQSDQYQEKLRVVKCQKCDGKMIEKKELGFTCLKCSVVENSNEFIKKVEEEENKITCELTIDNLLSSILDFSHYLILNKYLAQSTRKKLIANCEEKILKKIIEEIAFYYGEDHYNTIYQLEALAQAYKCGRKIKESKICYEKILKKYSQIYGENSYNTSQIEKEIQFLNQ